MRDFMRDQAQIDLAAFMARISPKIIVPLNEDALKPESTAPSFYCVHAITGAGVTDFSCLAKEVAGDVRFFAIQAPKKLMMDSDYGHLLKFIAGHYAEAIIKFQPEGRIHLGGWSSGALVAMEISKELTARGREVGLLVSIDGAPKNVKITGSWPRYLAKFLWNLPLALLNDDFGRLSGQFWFKIRKFRAKIRDQDDGGLACHPVQETIYNYSQYRAYQQCFMRELYDAIERTAFTRYDGAVVVYKATIMPIFLSGVQEFWKHVAPDSEIVNIPGTHANLVLQPYVRAIAVDLKRRFTRAEQKAP
jgi:thioesterase domain-containing protein